MHRFLALSAVAMLAAPAAQAVRTSAWITPWSSDALPSIEAHAGELDESNPVWYSLSADGEVVVNWNGENPAWRAAMSGTRLVPTIQNASGGRFDAALVGRLLATEATREAHAEAIASLVRAHAYDGIDLDYEALPADLRESFSAFVETLAAKLHLGGHLLSVTVHPKTSDAQDWKGPGAQDWARIGAAADSVKIMAYDYHWATSEPGPLAPLDWIESVTRYAVRVMPAEKVMIALPWYGYDWGTAGGKGVTWSEATGLALASGSTIERDADGEPFFRHGENEVWFQDAESYRRKVERILGAFPGIGGFAHWRAGAEDPAIWARVASLRGSAGSGVGRATGSFSIAGSSRLTVRAGESAAAGFSIVAIDAFSSPVEARLESSDAPAGMLSFEGGPLRAGDSATLTVAPKPSAEAGTYRVRLVFDAETNRVEQLVEIRIEAALRRRAARR